MIFILARATTYSALFIGVLLVYLPGRILSSAGIGQPAATGSWQVAGMMLGACGAVLALACILTFVSLGRGTPAPFDPPRRLVVRGPYRFVRNPMYLGASLALTGAALYYQSVRLFAYAAAFLLIMHVFVVMYEEPTLQRSFARDYEEYCKRVGRWIPFIVVLLPAMATLQQPVSPSSLDTRAKIEAFLSTATVVTEAPADRPNWRITLDSGSLKHDASVETADGSDPTRRDHRFNVAAYELDKLLGLNQVVPTVERVVSGRPASVAWWLDDFAMNELDRRRRGLSPPDAESWAKQMSAVRVFDELISNVYRDTSPPLYLNTVWDNLLITKDWTIFLTDHTGAFRVRRDLHDPDSVSRCPRAVFRKLRELNREALQRTLGRYLSSQQIEAMDVRRTLLVRHFDDLIARKGESAVLYDLPASR